MVCNVSEIEAPNRGVAQICETPAKITLVGLCSASSEHRNFQADFDLVKAYDQHIFIIRMRTPVDK